MPRIRPVLAATDFAGGIGLNMLSPALASTDDTCEVGAFFVALGEDEMPIGSHDRGSARDLPVGALRTG